MHHQEAVPAAPLVVVSGPAGSGKTVVGREVATRLGVAFVDGDDLHSRADVEAMRHGTPLDDRRRAPWLDRLHDELVARRHAGAVLACSALRASYRRRLARGLSEVRFVALAVSRDELHDRLVRRRDHFAGPELLDSQLADFELGPDVTVVDGHGPVDDVVQRVLDALPVDGGAEAPG